MEKFSQFRDRGTQIAPFLPIKAPQSKLQIIGGVVLIILRLVILITLGLSYFLILQWLPIGSFVRKAWLWSLLLVSGLWWEDLQVEGVKKGSLSKQPVKLPQPSTVVLSTCTSPLDVLYLAAIFDPVFTASYATTHLVEPLSLFSFLLRMFSPPQLSPPSNATLRPISTLLSQHPTRIIAVFPEGTATNGRGVLRFTPSLDTIPATTAIFPISLRYTPADVTTPIPRAYATFAYNLLSRPAHCIRVRIGEAIYNTPKKEECQESDDDDDEEDEEEEGTIILRTPYTNGNKQKIGARGDSYDEKKTTDFQHQSRISEKGGEALARIGRVKRLNLGVCEKMDFVEAWRKNNMRAN